VRASEPACGVGGMVLAANSVLRDAGIDPATEIYWHMVDVDFRAVCGCYLQCALTGAAGVVTHGNTLSLDEWSHSITPAAAVNWWLFSKAPEQPRVEIQKPVQLSLFGETA